MPGRYISPYNLDERMKRLDRPGLPEKPCICDPECMCADLCADDLTQNCLCEENGLFCLVTEGGISTTWTFPTWKVLSSQSPSIPGTLMKLSLCLPMIRHQIHQPSISPFSLLQRIGRS